VRAAVRPATQPVKAGPPVHAVPPAQKSGKTAGGLPKSGKARLWITIAASALILGIGSAVLFWNQPPHSKSGKQNPSQKQRTPGMEEPEQTSVPDSFATYCGADSAAPPQLCASHQFQAAADAFRNVHQNATSDSMVVEWALLHEGMA